MDDPLSQQISDDGISRINQLINDVEELKAREPDYYATTALEYYYEIATATPPSNASFRFDNADPSLAGNVHFDDDVRNGLDVRLILQMFATNDIGIVTEIGNSDNAVLFVISARLNPVGYITYQLSSVSVVGTHTDGMLYNLSLFTA